MLTAARSSATHQPTRSFVEEWSERKFPAYLEDYGGERAGVPKGDDIPFPPHKVKAAMALLAYGAPNHETLTAIVRPLLVSGALMRVWRTEERFLALYRRAVWECADDYIGLLSLRQNEERLAPYEEFQLYFGVSLQEAILRRLCVDVFHMDSEWEHLGLSPKWLSECTLVGLPPKAPPLFSKDETSLVNLNTFLLLATILVQRRIKDPVLAQWALVELMDKWTRLRVVNTDLRAAVEKNENKDAIGLIDFVTTRTPLDDVKRLYRLVHPAKTGRRR